MVADPKALSRLWEGAIGLFYPPQCPGCGAAMARTGMLCPTCWAEAEFITDRCCPGCGAPLPPGLDPEPGPGLLSGGGGVDPACGSCHLRSWPWQGARAAFVYHGTGRAMVLALKHGDRADLALPLGRWLAQAAAPLVVPGMVVVPVPLHPRRLLRRRYNQAALLAAQVARHHRLPMLPVALRRLRHTPMQDHRRLGDRFANQRDAIGVAARARARIAGRAVLVVDDVMASGATLSAAAQALIAAGAGAVSIATLARAVRDI